MLKKIKTTIFVFMFMAIALHPLPASAAISYKTLSVPQCTQAGWSWCWAACEQSVLGWFGINVGQYDIVSTLYSYPDPSANQPANYIQIKNSLTGNWNLHATASSVAPLSSTIKTQINNNQPIISGRDGHAEVVRGYYQDTGIGTFDIYYMNPSNGGYYYASWSYYTSIWDDGTVKDIYVI